MKNPLFNAAMALSALFFYAKKHKKHAPAELYRTDFNSNTRKMGLYLPDSIRQVFRFSWIKLKK